MHSAYQKRGDAQLPLRNKVSVLSGSRTREAWLNRLNQRLFTKLDKLQNKDSVEFQM